MQTRKAISPVVSTLILIGVGILLSLTISGFSKKAAMSYVKFEAVEYPYIYCSYNSDVSNARWKIVLRVANQGTQSVHLSCVYVNEKPVDVYDLGNGDALPSGSVIGTSLPSTGVTLLASEETEIFVWIGDNMFSSGTTILVRFGTVNNVSQNISVKLS